MLKMEAGAKHQWYVQKTLDNVVACLLAARWSHRSIIEADGLLGSDHDQILFTVWVLDDALDLILEHLRRVRRIWLIFLNLCN